MKPRFFELKKYYINCRICFSAFGDYNSVIMNYMLLNLIEITQYSTRNRNVIVSYHLTLTTTGTMTDDRQTYDQLGTLGFEQL